MIEVVIKIRGRRIPTVLPALPRKGDRMEFTDHFVGTLSGYCDNVEFVFDLGDLELREIIIEFTTTTNWLKNKDDESVTMSATYENALHLKSRRVNNLIKAPTLG